MSSIPHSTVQHKHLYGPQSTLSLENFGRNGRRVEDVPSFIRSYALVKMAAARANMALGVLDEARAEGIVEACHEIADGGHSNQFPTALVVGGGGTTTNMNFNEVIAERASQITNLVVHPNDHVNASQSTNDSYPTAMALTILNLAEAPIAALNSLASALETKGDEYSHMERLGRTCLQDAVTLSVGQTHRAHAKAIRRVAEGLNTAVSDLVEVPMGATVLGTGIGAPGGYTEQCVRELSAVTGRNLRPATDHFDALSHLDTYAAVASAGVRCSLIMAKIAGDLRFLSSGPVGGIGEVTLPATQAGSSIMPGKTNPVVPEFVMQLSYRIRGAGYTVESAVAAGELELNVMEPVIVDALINIFDDLQVAADSFAKRCVEGLKWNGARLQQNIAGAFDKWVSMAAVSGYDATTQEITRERQS